MSNFNSISEMVHSTNYASMSYRELLGAKNTYSWMINNRINPLLETKRHNEMVALSAFYLDGLRIFNATTAEIISCLKEASIRENVEFNPSQDVDDQTAESEVVDCQDKGETILALPEHSKTTTEEAVEIIPVEGSADEDQNNDAVLDSGTEGDTINEETEIIQAEPVSVDSTKDVETISSSSLVDKAIDVARKGAIPDEIKLNAPYYIEYTISHDAEGKVWRDGKYGRNMDEKDLEAFRMAKEKHMRLFRKKEVMMSTDDCMVYREDKNTLYVNFYHFPEQENGAASKTDSYSNDIPYDTRVDLDKTLRRMKKAIEKAKECSASIGSSNSPFYDKYIFYDNNVYAKLNKEPVRIIENEETLTEIMSALDTYARLYRTGTIVLSEENSVAIKVSSNIYVAVFNFPSQSKKSLPAPKRKRTVKKKTEAVTKDNTTPEVNPLIAKAVEMTKALQVGNGTDVNAPYFIQCELSVIGEGELIQKGKPFSKNISGDEELAKLRKNHQRFAKTMKAINPVSTDTYTAYIWNEGKNVSVFYYNTKDRIKAAA